MNKKTLSLVTASALLTTSAFSQVTVSGYTESSLYFAGETKGATNNNVSTKKVGNETVIRMDGKGKLSTGQDVSIYALVDSDDAGSGLHERGFTIGLNPNFTFNYGFDRVLGSEIVRTLTPFATNRIRDVSANLGTVDFTDITSGEHAFALNANDLLGKGSVISAAIAPNMDAAKDASSDNIATATSSQSGYSVGVRVVPVNGLTIGAGLTKADSKVAANQDLTAKTLGFSFAQAPFAIGAQRVKNEGLKTAQSGLREDQVDIFSATYAVTKELTAGLSHSTMERTVGTTKSPVDADVTILSLAYNLGPVVVSYDHERGQDLPIAETSGNVRGVDTTLNKIKVRVAF